MLKKIVDYFKKEIRLTKEYYQQVNSSPNPPSENSLEIHTPEEIEVTYQGLTFMAPKPMSGEDYQRKRQEETEWLEAHYDLNSVAGILSIPERSDLPRPPNADSGGLRNYTCKERIMVQRVTTKDMMQFKGMPYLLNAPIHKLIEEHAHPFAYINLNRSNISIAKTELSKINSRIATDSALVPMIPCSLRIPVDHIVFAPSKEDGYTRIICTPYTFDGEISDYPVSLVFMTDLYGQTDTTHGTLYYNPDGVIAKADIYFWRGNEGFFFYYETLNRSFVLSKVELSRLSSVYQSNTILYKDQYWIDLEATRKRESCDFKWLQAHIPEKCPKSIVGFRRMKHSNTANYQKLVARAKELGRIIE